MTTNELVSFALGTLAGTGWLLATFLYLVARHLRRQFRFAVRCNHDLAIALEAERQIRVQAAHAAACGCSALDQTAIDLAAVLAKHGGSPKPGAN